MKQWPLLLLKCILQQLDSQSKQNEQACPFSLVSSETISVSLVLDNDVMPLCIEWNVPPSPSLSEGLVRNLSPSVCLALTVYQGWKVTHWVCFLSCSRD